MVHENLKVDEEGAVKLLKEFLIKHKTKTMENKLNATNLKNALWDTLQKIQSGEMEPGKADSIATQAREIVRTTSLQLRVAAQSNRDVPVDVLNFSESK